MVNVVKNNEFENIKNADIAFVDFSATWCGPCKMVAPVVEELSEELTNIQFFNVDVDENDEIAEQFEITNIPTMVILKNGEVVGRTVGFQPKAQLSNWINSNI